MKDYYEVKSERYGYTHKFVKTLGSNYTLSQQEKWMHMSMSVDPATKKIATIDPGGGPVFYVGWKNDEIEVKDIYQLGTVIFFLLGEVKKTENAAKDIDCTVEQGPQSPNC